MLFTRVLEFSKMQVTKLWLKPFKAELWIVHRMETILHLNSDYEIPYQFPSSAPLEILTAFSTIRWIRSNFVSWNNLSTKAKIFSFIWYDATSLPKFHQHFISNSLHRSASHRAKIHGSNQNTQEHQKNLHFYRGTGLMENHKPL